MPNIRRRARFSANGKTVVKTVTAPKDCFYDSHERAKP